MPVYRESLEDTVWWKIRVGASVFGGCCVLAVIGYWLAGWDLLEAVYMVVITIYGVGYGEVRPIDDPLLRMFTIGVIIVGCTSAIYTIGALAQMIAEGEVNRLLGARRMTRGISELEGHTILCGFGRVGQILAGELAACGRPFVIVDMDRERATLAEERGHLVVIGDATEDETLQMAGIDKAVALVTALPDDAANVFITLTARELRSDLRIIARAELPTTKNKLRRSGADKVVLPAEIGADRIARLLLHPTAEAMVSSESDRGQLNDELEPFGLALGELKLPADSYLIGARLAEARFASSRGVVVVAIRRADGTTDTCPSGDTTLAANDTLVVVGHGEDVPRFASQVASPPVAGA